MALSNGGVIGTDNDPAAATQSAAVTTFNSSGTFTAASRTTACNLLVVAGGGSGAFGGGGAGGYRAINPHPLPASAVTVTIGAGGAPTSPMSYNAQGSDGSNTVFASATPITARWPSASSSSAGPPTREGRRT